MKKITCTNLALTVCLITLNAGTAFSQVWQSHSLVEQHYPNNDVKSYGGKLWVANNKGLFNSSDNGATWTNLTSSFPANSDLVEIQFTNSGNVFVRKNSMGVIRSLDGGTTWEMDTAGVGSNYGTNVLYYDGVSDKVFLGIAHPKYKLYYQAPSDAAWAEVTGLPSGLNNFSPVQMTRKGSKLFVVDAYKRVLESSDDGLTWVQKAGTGLIDAQSQVGPSRFLPIGDDLYYGIGGIWKSTDDGDSWTKIDQGFPTGDTRCLYYDGSTLYTSVYSDRKTYKSTDNGATWVDFGGTGSWFFKAMAMHNGTLYGVIHSKDSLYILGNGGATGVSENTQNLNFQICPNPANDFVTIGNISNGATVKVLDMIGRVVYQGIAETDYRTISTEHFVNGVYLILVESEGMIAKKKLVISR